MKHQEETMTNIAFPNGNIPPYIKSAMIFIERIGFPIFATGAIFWMANSSVCDLTKALRENTATLNEIRTDSKLFRELVSVEHKQLLEEVRRLQ